MEVWLGFFLLLVRCFAIALRAHAENHSGFISLDCGTPEDAYIDEKTKIRYTWDAGYIESGQSRSISSDLASNRKVEKQFLNVRSFPQGMKNCYALPIDGQGNTRYLVRAWFMYGNYDALNEVPKFDVYLGVNLWATVEFDNATHIRIYEIIHAPPVGYNTIDVCLLNTRSGTPFISVLELRNLSYSIYNTTSQPLILFNRLDVGSTSSDIVRYPDDEYDRIWWPNSYSAWEPLITSLTVDSRDNNTYIPPSLVMRTAVTPANGSSNLRFSWEWENPSTQFYVYLHFAETQQLQESQSRKFYVYVGPDKIYNDALTLNYLSTTTLYNLSPLSGRGFLFDITQAGDSTLPPILNALEIYSAQQLPQSPTNSKDVDAMKKIKAKYKVNRTNWQGDPCGPNSYRWDGLNCSYNDAPTIILLDLASSGLTGEITPSLENLTSLQHLDLSNNGLTGEVPDFLTRMSSLKYLNLSGNRLTGSVPTALMERSNDGLTLSLEDNPELCLQSASCGKKRKIPAVALVATVTSLLLLVILFTVALIFFWGRRGRKHKATQKQPPSDDAKNGVQLSESRFHRFKKSFSVSKVRRFTYSEVERITNDFQKSIGKGGFGIVYHGCLEDTMVAVKELSPESFQGFKEFQTEAQLLSTIHHKNLVRFIGYCDEGVHKVLVYEYMDNGNLRDHLSGKKGKMLSWVDRLRIAVDAAQGLEYLHNGCKPPIVHRDVKTPNILLDNNMQAKIADFGLCKYIPSQSIADHVIASSLAGTPGYLDPEYRNTGKLNEKSDVYSFGIVILELITGQPAIIESNGTMGIRQWVNPIVRRGQVRDIIDQRLPAGDVDIKSIWKVVDIALACTEDISIKRPTMNDVVVELKQCLTIYNARDDLVEKHSTKSVGFGAIPLDTATETGPSAR